MERIETINNAMVLRRRTKESVLMCWNFADFRTGNRHQIGAGDGWGCVRGDGVEVAVMKVSGGCGGGSELWPSWWLMIFVLFVRRGGCWHSVPKIWYISNIFLRRDV